VVLHEAYTKRLTDLVAAYTRAGRIDDALATREEVTRVQSAAIYTDAQALLKTAAEAPQEDLGATPTPPSEPVRSQPASRRSAGTPFWWHSRSGDVVQIPGRDRSVPLRLEGVVTRDGQGLEFKGGRVRVPGVDEALLADCRASNTLGIDLRFSTESLDQTGPARILSFSTDSMTRNVSICQERDRLVLRLRTTETGENGTHPEVELTRIEAGRRYFVSVFYEPGDLRVRVNGKPVEVQQIEGDFSNWSPQNFVLGNEADAERPWHGRISAFHVRSQMPQSRR